MTETRRLCSIYLYGDDWPARGGRDRGTGHAGLPNSQGVVESIRRGNRDVRVNSHVVNMLSTNVGYVTLWARIIMSKVPRYGVTMCDIEVTRRKRRCTTIPSDYRAYDCYFILQKLRTMQFPVTAACLWNSLPSHVTVAPSLSSDVVLSPVHTVAEKCHCRRCLAVFCASLTFLRQCDGQGFKSHLFLIFLFRVLTRLSTAPAQWLVILDQNDESLRGCAVETIIVFTFNIYNSEKSRSAKFESYEQHKNPSPNVTRPQEFWSPNGHRSL